MIPSISGKGFALHLDDMAQKGGHEDENSLNTHRQPVSCRSFLLLRSTKHEVALPGMLVLFSPLVNIKTQTRIFLAEASRATVAVTLCVG